MAPAVELRSPNHWTAREFPVLVGFAYLRKRALSASLTSWEALEVTDPEEPGRGHIQEPPSAIDKGAPPREQNHRLNQGIFADPLRAQPRLLGFQHDLEKSTDCPHLQPSTRGGYFWFCFCVFLAVRTQGTWWTCKGVNAPRNSPQPLSEDKLPPWMGLLTSECRDSTLILFPAVSSAFGTCPMSRSIHQPTDHRSAASGHIIA
ncbi:uncharacterized protein LOC130859242 [Hippopotamus amphibius kiboko]|uniref:uncharacterized protein LOC130859242 n=1 Tax=Hippopotamus amphibius kiboko TaxID=575201 RepID=UPI002597BD7E|nr:uncharacterized protein LOC130859242 [Hippopotamus amphibius kiboko]